MKPKKSDLILVLIILSISLCIFAVIKFTQKCGDSVTVSIDGVNIGEYSLLNNNEIKLGDKKHSNTLIIKDGYAFIEEASCPDKICVRRGKISRDGENIICLPNKTVITVKSNKSPSADFVQ